MSAPLSGAGASGLLKGLLKRDDPEWPEEVVLYRAHDGQVTLDKPLGSFAGRSYKPDADRVLHKIMLLADDEQREPEELLAEIWQAANERLSYRGTRRTSLKDLDARDE